MVSPSLMRMVVKSNKSADDGYDPTSLIPTTMYCMMVNAFQKGCYHESILELWEYDNDVISKLTKEDIVHAIASTTIRYNYF